VFVVVHQENIRHIYPYASLDAAGLSPHASKSAPIRDALMRWVSNFTPRD